MIEVPDSGPQPARILLIRPSALGDVCRTVPVLASLRKAWPDAAIDWVVQEEFAAAVSAHPAVRQVIPFARRRLRSWWWNPAATAAAFGWLNRIRRERYDLTIDCQGLFRSGLISTWSGARHRVGHRRAREFAWLGYNVPYEGPMPEHTVDQMMVLLTTLDVQPVSDMDLYVPTEDDLWWNDARVAHDIGRSSYAVLAPTARWITKRWPVKRWRELVEPLLERGFERIVVIGAPGEREQVRGIEPVRLGLGDHVVNLVGETSVGQTMAIVAGADLVIANDSAPLHMAVGFERPLIALFGPTEPARVGPYGHDDCVVRAYKPRPGEQVHFKNTNLGDSLMRMITVANVVEKIDEVLEADGSLESQRRKHSMKKPAAGSSVSSS